MSRPAKTDRNREIIRDYQALVKQDIKRAAKKVGVRYGISERRVYAILKRFNKIKEEMSQND